MAVMRKIYPLIACLCLLSLTSSLSHAQLYKWVDDEGKLHYGDSPPENVELKKITGEITSIPAVRVEPSGLDTGQSKAAAAKRVVLYSTSWCGYCRQAAQYFRQKKIPFTEYDIEKSTKGARDYKRLKGRGVPVILIGKKRMDGFSVGRFNQIYYDS
jgi:glutaredoxin